MDLKQMYEALMQRGYDKPRVLNTIKHGMNPNVGYLISQYGESTPEVALANAYPEVFGYEFTQEFPSDLNNPQLDYPILDELGTYGNPNNYWDGYYMDDYLPFNVPVAQQSAFDMVNNLRKAFPKVDFGNISNDVLADMFKIYPYRK